MKIELKSNWAFLIKLVIPLAAVGLFSSVVCAIVLGINYSEQKDVLPYLIMLVVYTAVMAVVALVAKFRRVKWYEFSESEIVCYKKDREVLRIDVSKVDIICFYACKLSYVFPILSALPEGGCWKLHVLMKDGTKYKLSFFSKKDAMTLKKKLYGALLTVS